ncbi:MAG: hypothetical protein ACTHJT_06240 [Cytophaga sp.]|uniref:hypothetical protein n=1 Tax=Cytophaga sp. TaxID=29535 RepID=UPI003F7E92CA
MNLKPIVVGLILGCIHGVNSYLLYLIVEKLVSGLNIALKRWVIFAACLMGFYGAAAISEVGTTFGDNVVSLFILTALYILIRQLINCYKISGYKINLWVILSAGLLMGFAAGVKLTTAIYPVAFVLSLAWVAKNVKEYVQIGLVYGSAVCISFSASMGYWMYLQWMRFGNPTYPFFNNIFQSPYGRITNPTDIRFFPKGFFQTLFYPFYFVVKQTYTAEVTFRDMHLAVCYCLLIGFVGFFCYKKFVSKETEIFTAGNYKMYFFIISFFVLSYILWQKLFSIYRYVLLLEILSPVFVLIILSFFSMDKKRFSFLFMAISVLTVSSVSQMEWGRISWAESYFKVEVPAIAHLEDANIIMAGEEPSGYIVPFFPEKTRFLRIEGNFISLKDTTLYQKKLLEQIKSNSYNYLLMHNLNLKTVTTIEKKTGLQVDSATCVNFKTRIDELCLCALVKDTSRIADEAGLIKRTYDQNP